MLSSTGGAVPRSLSLTFPPSTGPVTLPVSQSIPPPTPFPSSSASAVLLRIEGVSFSATEPDRAKSAQQLGGDRSAPLEGASAGSGQSVCVLGDDDLPLLTGGEDQCGFSDFEDVFGRGIFEMPVPSLRFHPPVVGAVRTPTNFDISAALPEDRRAIVGIHAVTLVKALRHRPIGWSQDPRRCSNLGCSCATLATRSHPERAGGRYD